MGGTAAAADLSVRGTAAASAAAAIVSEAVITAAPGMTAGPHHGRPGRALTQVLYCAAHDMETMLRVLPRATGGLG